MALRMTEEEYAEWLRGRRAGASQPPSRQSAPTCCQPAKASGVSMADMDEKPKRSKYGNQRVEVDGIKFASKHEAAIYQELMLRVRAGELKTVCRQVKFDLPSGIVYIADFVTIRPDLSIEGVYDAKSEATKKNRVYVNKKKQMKACWDIEVQEV